MHTYDLSGGKLCDKLVAGLRSDILGGGVAPGERLPSKRRMAERYGISVQTVQNAYEQLIAEGYIESRERSGYFAATLPSAPISTCTVPPVDEVRERRYALDLVTNATDPDRFPFALWSRLSRRVLCEEGELLSPSPAAGVYPLREAIAAHLAAQRGMTVSPAQIVIGAGNDYLYQLLPQLLGREKRYGLENPGHTKIAGIYRANGVDCLPVPVDGEGVDCEAAEALGVDVLHISPNHHFPTGVLTSAARRAALLVWLGKGERYIVEDDYDSEFRFTGRPIPTLFDRDASDRVIYMNTFSKTIAPSIRVSYMVLPPALLARYRAELGFYACPVSAFEQYTLSRFLAQGHFERHLNRMRAFYRARRDAVIKLLLESPFAPYMEIKEADAGLHFLLRIKTDRTDEALRALLEQADVRVAFLQDYRIDGARNDTKTLVFNYSAVSPQSLADGIARLVVLCR